MLLLSWIRKIYKVLSTDTSPEAIGFAAAFGLLAGFLPIQAGFTLLLFLLILVLRVQVSCAIAFWAIGALLRFALAPIFYNVGEALLQAESLKGFWTTFLNLPVVAWLSLDYYAVLGAVCIGVFVGPAIFILIRQLVIAYRKWAHDKLSGNRFFRWLTNFWLTKALRFVFIGGR